MFKIALADSHEHFAFAADDTIMRAALRAGIGMPYECNVGSCGTCKVELVSGEVESNWPEAPALTDRDCGRRRVLACQSRPAGDCTVKARLAEQYQTGRRPQRFEATMTACRDLTHDFREFRFQLATPVNFLPGQYALLYLPSVNGPRAYSMSYIAQGDGSWHFMIRRLWQQCAVRTRARGRQAEAGRPIWPTCAPTVSAKSLHCRRLWAGTGDIDRARRGRQSRHGCAQGASFLRRPRTARHLRRRLDT